MSHYASLLTDVIHVEPYVGSDGHSDPLYGPRVKMRARHEQGVTMLRDTDGVERQSTDRIATAKPVGPKDRVWLPGADLDDERDARTPIIVRSAARPDRTLTVYRAFF